MSEERENCLFQNENIVVLNENSVGGKSCIDREIKSLEITIQLYSSYYEYEVPIICNTTVIYRGCSTRKIFWEENFTGEEKLFSAVNMKIMVVIMLGNTRR